MLYVLGWFIASILLIIVAMTYLLSELINPEESKTD